MKYFILVTICMLSSLTGYAQECIVCEDFYVRASGGVSYLHDHIKEFDIKYKSGYAASIGLGGYLCPFLRWELEGLYLKNNIKEVLVDRELPSGLKGHVHDVALMGNIYFVPHFFDGFEPYAAIGGGCGFERVRLSGEKLPPIRNKENRLVYQGLAGVAFRVWSPDCMEVWVTADCRYFSFDKHVRAIIGLAGLQLRF